MEMKEICFTRNMILLFRFGETIFISFFLSLNRIENWFKKKEISVIETFLTATYFYYHSCFYF